MASSFFLSVGLCLAFFSGLSEGAATNCTLPEGVMEVLRNDDFSSVSDLNVDGCEAIRDLIAQLNNLKRTLNTTNMESALLASRSVTFSSLDEVLVHIEEKGNLTLNCSVTIPTTYVDVSISLMRDGEDVPIDKAWHVNKVVATNVINGTAGMRSRLFTIKHPVPKNLTGDFTCVMDAASSEGHHNVSWTIPVMVHEPLHVEVTKNVEATEDKAINILCTVSGNPIPDTVTWTEKENSGTEHKLKNDTSTLLTSHPEKEFAWVFTLTILDPKVDMNGYQYSCSAFDNINGTSTASDDAATLSVKASLSIDYSESVTGTEGEEMNITCTFSGKHLPSKVTWQLAKGEDEFKNVTRDNYKQLTVGDGEGEPKGVFILTIMNLNATMNGDKFKCVPLQGPAYKLPKDSPTSTKGLVVKVKVSTEGAEGSKQPEIWAIAVAVVVLVVLCGAVYVVYWKRHMLRAWLMEKDVVKVIRKQKRAKGYRYSKLPKNISSSMKHLE